MVAESSKVTGCVRVFRQIRFVLRRTGWFRPCDAFQSEQRALGFRLLIPSMVQRVQDCQATRHRLPADHVPRSRSRNRGTMPNIGERRQPGGPVNRLQDQMLRQDCRCGRPDRRYRMADASGRQTVASVVSQGWPKQPMERSGVQAIMTIPASGLSRSCVESGDSWN